MNARNELPVSDAVQQTANPIGQSTPRTGARKLLQGRGMYLDDMRVPRLAFSCVEPGAVA
jgi:CO/xanthine dehydrogenase Mo-binding subunit